MVGDDRVGLGAYVQRRRVEAGLNRPALLQRAGLSQTALFRIENDKRSDPELATMIRIILALHAIKHPNPPIDAMRFDRSWQRRVGLELRSTWEKRGLDRVRLSSLAGVSETTLLRLERGDGIGPGFLSVARVLETLGLSFSAVSSELRVCDAWLDDFQRTSTG